jgi:hypothetical protein
MAADQKKQVPLRRSSNLYTDLAVWAEEDFRSINGQIEYLLFTCVKERKKSGAFPPPGKDK